MDTYRGSFIDRHEDADGYSASDPVEDEAVHEPPPSPVGQDERRMQVRAYNHWASLLDSRNFPSIEDLDPTNLPDFGPHSVLLDFTGGIENPSVQYLGDKLAEECGAGGVIETLADVPSRSLLSRITDHYMQILANQAPIGFEAEFVNQREKCILYRGILLPFSSDDDTIDFIYGVINWKELADRQTTETLLEEINSALDVQTEPRASDALTNWADGPGSSDALADVRDDADDILDLEVEAGDDVYELDSAMSVATGDDDWDEDDEEEDVLDLASLGEELSVEDEDDWAVDLADPEPAATEADQTGDRVPLDLASLAFADADAEDIAAHEQTEPDPADMGLADWLASARELAELARGSEDRSRQALYAAIGRAYDFSLAAAEAPDDFAELLADAGLAVQDRAPLTPVVKLVFGIDYDKTRLAEYATALGHAHRVGVGRSALATYLAEAKGGLKGVVADERRFKRGESGPAAAPRTAPRPALARKLRKLEGMALDAIPAEGNEFTLLVARRLPGGEVVVLGEVANDLPLLERAAKSILN